MTALRQQLHSYLDCIDEIKLPALKPLFSMLAVDEFEAVIETDLTDEEIADLDRREAEYREHPENFISLNEFIAREYPNGMPPTKCHLRYDDVSAPRKKSGAGAVKKTRRPAHT
jgi:hypothetical protein